MTISIITPSFGQLDWLRLCIASVADQVALKAEEIGSQNSEVGSQVLQPSPVCVEHIIQDGGTPGIEEFAREFGAEFYRDGVLVFGALPSAHATHTYRLVIYSEPDLGMYDALNKGISKMTGELWCWLNSDEQYLPGTFDYVEEWFTNHPDTEILCGDALLTDSEGKALSYRRIIAPDWRHTRLVHLASLSCASFYRRSVVDRVGGFDIAWRSIGDAEWMARMIRNGIRIRACGRLFSTFAFTGQNTSESPRALLEASRWREGKDAPPLWQIMPVIWWHRIRKFLKGAYRRRSVKYAVHTPGVEGRVTRVAKNLGWGWPCSETAANKQSASQSEGKDSDKSDSTAVLGTDLLETDYEGLSSALLAAVSGNEAVLAVDFANTQIVTMRRHEPAFAKLSRCIDWTLPDGMPLVWAMNRKGAGLSDRVYGPTFTRHFLASCPEGKTHYLVGGSEECGRRFRERMLELNPTLHFVGGYHGGCSRDGVLEDDAAVLADILDKKPDFIWVGLGTPKQYGWIAGIKPKLEHGVLFAVGFAFDVNAGMKPDAPLWMQRLGLTWLFRMASEPRRLLGRYLKWNTLFLWYVFLELMGWDSYRKDFCES